MSRKILCDLRDISSPQLFVWMNAKYFQLKSLKAMEIFSGYQMRGPTQFNEEAAIEMYLSMFASARDML